MKTSFHCGMAVLLTMVLPSCGTLVGAGAGGGVGYGIARMAGANTTGTVLATAGGAVAGGLIGNMIDKSKADEKDWKQLQRESVKAGEPTRTRNADGTMIVAQTMLHKPTCQYWDWVVKYSAPDGNSAPKVDEEWATNWREAPEDAAQQHAPKRK